MLLQDVIKESVKLTSEYLKINVDLCCANKQTKRGTRIVFTIELRFQELVGVDLKRDTFQK